MGLASRWWTTGPASNADFGFRRPRCRETSLGPRCPFLSRRSRATATRTAPVLRSFHSRSRVSRQWATMRGPIAAASAPANRSIWTRWPRRFSLELTRSAQKPCLLRSQHSYVVLLSPERDCLITRTRRVSAHRAVYGQYDQARSPRDHDSELERPGSVP